MVNDFFEHPAWMVNRRTSLSKPYGKQMINLQRPRNAEQGLEHDAEIGRGHMADVTGTEPQHLGGQQHLQDAVRQAAVIMHFPLVELRAHWIGVVRERIAEHDYMAWRMAEVHAGIHAVSLAARRLLDFDLVSHLSLIEFRNLFPNLQVSYDKEFPGLRISRLRRPSRRFQDFFNQFIRDRRVPQKAGANATAPLKHLQKGVNRLGTIWGWMSARRLRSHDSDPH
jgi:hypothetical protein